ncbi:MAG TPA: hypothetical protein VGG03_27540 [Thermoanaerobaculia bacterium]
MRKLTLLTGAILALVLALISGLSTARPAWAICYCDPYEPYSQTNYYWGIGSTCTDAYNNLVANTNNEAYQACGGSTKTCLGDVVVTGQCWWNGWAWQWSGYRQYKCKVCEPIDREPRVP